MTQETAPHVPASLADFLLARIAEDERDLPPIGDGVERLNGQLVDWSERVLADCEAKRQIVEFASHADQWPIAPTADLHDGAEMALGVALRALAVPYADHPDYDEGWRP